MRDTGAYTAVFLGGSPAATPLGRLAARVTVLMALSVAVASIAVLARWSLGSAPLWHDEGSTLVMLPGTAVAFLCSAAALWLRRRPPALGGDSHPRVARGLAIVAAVLATASFVGRVTGHDGGVGLLFFPEAVLRLNRPPHGLMAINSSVCFVLAALALVFLNTPSRHGRPAQWLASAGLAVAAIATVGHLYGAPAFYTIDKVSGMASATAACFVALHTGILLSRPDRGAVALLTGADSGAQVARRLLPAVTVIPLILGWIWIEGLELSYVSLQGGVALYVVATIVVLTIVVLLSARALRATDYDRATALTREASARTEAEQASRAKSDFLAVMSHELRTPLNAILGYQSLLADGITGPVTEPQVKQLRRIEASARHLVGLIDEILTLARVEAGHETVRRESLDLDQALEEAASMAAPQAAAKGLAFTVEPAPKATMITDRAKVRQILLNLLSNAIKFTDHGSVTLTAARADATILFTVRDTGVGIATEHLERIFDDFWQVEQPTTRRATGTGLGLAVSRRLAHLLGGDLVVTSIAGDGSTFVLSLPLEMTDALATLPDQQVLRDSSTK